MYLKLTYIFVQSYDKLDNDHYNNDQHGSCIRQDGTRFGYICAFIYSDILTNMR